MLTGIQPFQAFAAAKGEARLLATTASPGRPAQ